MQEAEQSVLQQIIAKTVEAWTNFTDVSEETWREYEEDLGRVADPVYNGWERWNDLVERVEYRSGINIETVLSTSAIGLALMTYGGMKANQADHIKAPGIVETAGAGAVRGAKDFNNAATIVTDFVVDKLSNLHLLPQSAIHNPASEPVVGQALQK